MRYATLDTTLPTIRWGVLKELVLELARMERG